MSIKGNVATCDHCKNKSHTFGCNSLDSVTRKDELVNLGWDAWRLHHESKTMHLCRDCNDE